mgnify:CR=1 FL=1
MAKTSMKVKQQRPQKYKVREYTRCERCGRPHSVIRKFKLCRICFRELAYKGEIPGVKKQVGNDKIIRIGGGHANGNDRSNCRYVNKNP